MNLALLQDVLAYLTMRAPFLPTRRRFLMRRALADRIETRLRQQWMSAAGQRAVGFARAQLRSESLRIEPDEDEVQESADAIWVRAWLRVDRDAIAGEPTPEIRDRYIEAVNALPHFTREVFLLLRVDHLGYEEIATRLAITRREVKQHVQTAMAHITHALDGQSDVS